jgi:hypothetical protein
LPSLFLFVLGLAEQIGQLRDIRRDPARLIACELIYR